MAGHLRNDRPQPASGRAGTAPYTTGQAPSILGRLIGTRTKKTSASIALQHFVYFCHAAAKWSGRPSELTNSFREVRSVDRTTRVVERRF